MVNLERHEPTVDSPSWYPVRFDVSPRRRTRTSLSKQALGSKCEVRPWLYQALLRARFLCRLIVCVCVWGGVAPEELGTLTFSDHYYMPVIPSLSLHSPFL